MLVVNSNFPAHGGSRIDKFVKYLPMWGWKPVVLAARENLSAQSQEWRRALYPADLECHYARSILPSYFSERFFGRGLSGKHYRLLQWLSLPERFVFVPDFMVRWIPLGIRMASRLVRQHGIEVVLTSSPTESTHLIGWALKRRFHIRWVADFRDLWTEKKLVHRPATPLHGWGIQCLERQVMARADHIIANTEENRAYYQRVFGVVEHRMSVIPNGFDWDDLSGVETDKRSDGVLRIGYMGNLSKHDFPWKLFLTALKRLVDTVGPAQIRFVHCGFYADEVRAYVQEMDLEDVVVSHGNYSHGEAVRVIAATDIQLLLLYETPYSEAIVPLKLYSYLIMPGPILALAPEQGATARLITETGTGVVISPSRGMEVIYQQLQQYFDAWKRGKLTCEPCRERLNRYDHRLHTARLADIFLKRDA